MVSACGMREVQSGIESGWVGRDRGGVRRKGHLNKRLDNGVDIHVWQWR